MKRILFIYLSLIFSMSCQNKSKNDISIDKTFQGFLFKFNNDSIFQKARVKFPICSIELESENFTELHRNVDRKHYKLINLTKNKTDQKREGFTQKIKLDKNKATIEIRGIENGIMGDYYFEKINGKWYLVGWSDVST